MRPAFYKDYFSTALGIFCLALGLLPFSKMSRAGQYDAKPTLNFQTLRDLIESHPIHSIEELLPLLPTDFRSRYTLVFASRSLQASSFENPRVLLFNEDASFMASFNGDPGQKGFHAFETMEFNPKSAEFQYREIEFKPEKITYSEVNPERCLKCHGSPARPIWDSWPLWPGVYGERYHAALSDDEQKGLDSFLARREQNSRYKHLLRSEVFANRETFNPTHENKYNGRQTLSPNEQLSRALSNLNSERIAKTLQQSPDYKHYQYALLAALSDECKPIELLFPKELREHIQKTQKEFYLRTELKNTQQDELKKLRALNPNQGVNHAFRDSEKEALEELRLIAEDGLKIPTDQWTTALESGTYDFTAPLSVRKKIENRLLAQLGQLDPKLLKFAHLRDVSPQPDYCSYLEHESIAGLSQLSAQKFATLASQAPTSLKTCAMCHDGDVGPSYPFNNPAELAKLLLQGTYPRGTLMEEIKYRLSPQAGIERMPRGRNITEEERAALEGYLQTLVRK